MTNKNKNTGHYNTGDYNTGHCNAGSCNAGNCNTGHCNTGSWNTGDYNTGKRNTGNWNTGCNNTGDRNTGEYNTGDFNTGEFNTGDFNTGYCNSVTEGWCLIFNKPALRSEWMDAKKPEWMYVSLTKWVGKSGMSDEEKEAYPSYVTTGGYLKRYSSLKKAYIEAWERTTQEDRDLTRKLPNFDEDVFEEVFGFNPWKTEKKEEVIEAPEVEDAGEV